MKQILPILVGSTGFALECVEISELPVFAERQDQQVVQALSLGRPLALDDASPGPRRLTDVVRVLFLLRTALGRRYQTREVRRDRLRAYVSCPKDFATSKLQKGALRSARNRSWASVVLVMFLNLGTISVGWWW